MGEQRAQPGAGDGSSTGVTGPGLALGVGAVTALVVLLALNPVLVNAEGPLGEHPALARIVTILVALGVGAGTGFLTLAVARRSIIGLAVLVAGLAAAAVVLYPTRVDSRESFVEQPNERSSCLGVTFEYYPPRTFDASRVIYCVGLERPLPPG